MDRRTFMLGGIGVAALMVQPARSDESSASAFDQLEFPPYLSIDKPIAFGFGQPSGKDMERAADIARQTDQMISESSPRMTPIDVAESFIERFKERPELISQWPAPSAWNPLVVSFLRSTGYPAHNDMIAWCAAFANWCIEHSLGKDHTSGSASSQSFLQSSNFRATSAPMRGDLAVFTVFQKGTKLPVSPPLGHVAFVKQSPANGRIELIGGNQSADGHSSIICEKSFPISPFPVRRHVRGEYIACTMALNRYVTFQG